MVCVLIPAPLFGAGINGPCGGKLRRGGLRFLPTMSGSGASPFLPLLYLHLLSMRHPAQRGFWLLFFLGGHKELFFNLPTKSGKSNSTFSVN
jgi:hypothetical protein